MAILDLAKTSFEEESILEKRTDEVFRRPLMRFLTAAAIAALFKMLVLIFKFSLTKSQNLVYVFLLIFWSGISHIVLRCLSFCQSQWGKKDMMK